MHKKILTIFVLVFSAILSAETFPNVFEERAKCAMIVKFIAEYEEDRSQITTTGLLLDESGLIMIPVGQIPDIQPRCLKDFKVYIHGGDEDGYPADFLGSERLTNQKFIRIRGKLPKEMTPVSKFGKGELEIGQWLWGVGLTSERNSYMPYCLRSYVCVVDRSPLLSAEMGAAIAAVGCPVFDNDGKFVGVATTPIRERKGILLDDGTRAAITLLDSRSQFVLSHSEIEPIVKNIPKNPSGDPHGWLGVVGLQFLKKDVSKFLGLTGKFGLVASDIIKNSPADKAGLKKGDIIVGFNGKDLERLNSDNDSREKFVRELQSTKVGEKVKLNIIGGGNKNKTIEVEMGKNPRDAIQSEFCYFKRLGFSISEFTMNDAIARRMLDGLKDFAKVRFVKANSPASSATPAALAGGYIIREINSKPVKTYAEAVEILKKIDADKTVKEVVILAEDYSETKVVKIKLD